MKDSLIILSGGLDSTTLLYQYSNNIALAVFFKYNQKHIKEYSYALSNTQTLGIPFMEIDLSNIFTNINSHLLNSGGDIPEGPYTPGTLNLTSVPFRNGIFLSCAAGIAESWGLKKVLIGIHKGDHPGYPDCSLEFFSSFFSAVYAGTFSNILIEASYIYKTKKEIVAIGRLFNVPFQHTWSCYKGGDFHCGTCSTCIERQQALKPNDSTIYLVNKGD